MRVKILNKKRKHRTAKKPKETTSCVHDNHASKKRDEYFYKGEPYGVKTPHV